MSRTRLPAAVPVSPSLSPRFSFALEPLEARELMSSVDVTVNTAARHQTIDGFGTSLGGAPSLGLLKNRRFQKMYWQDLGSSMFRADMHDHVLSAGKGSNYATPVYMGPSIQKNIRLMNFNNYNVLINGVMARSALKYGQGEIKIIGSLWTPPYWMKGPEVDMWTGKPNGNQPWIDSGGTTGGGSLVDTPANLTQFGRYVAAYVKGFEQAFGTPMYAISIQNELAFREGYSSCVYSPKLYVDAVKAVAHWFKVYGITTKLIGPEDVGVGSTTKLSILKRQMNYIDAVRNDKEAFAALSGYAIHGYADDGVTQTRSPEEWSAYWNGRTGNQSFTGIRNDGKTSWMTEISGGLNSWPTAMRTAGNALDALVQGNVSAWIYWGISTSDPNQHNYALMMDADPKSTRYVMAKHFFKYIRPGAVRVSTSNEDPAGIYSAAFVHDAEKTLTVVVANEGTKEQTVNLHVPGTAVTAFDIGYESTATKEWTRLKDIPVKNGVASITLPAQSLLTLRASTAVKQPPGAITGIYFRDANANGRLDAGEQLLGRDTVYLDTNHNGAYDPGEPKTTTSVKGRFSFAGVAPGTYEVVRTLPAGWRTTTATTAVVVKPKQTTSVLIGAAQADTSKAAISGIAFNDTDANGVYNNYDSLAAGKTIYLDANNNGRLDAGERATQSDDNGQFSFTGLKPGAYRIARVFFKGYASSTAAINVNVKAGQTFSGIAIGAKLG